MTTLVVEDLQTLVISTTITSTTRIIVESIRPYLYFNLLPDETYTLTVKTGIITVASKSLTRAEIIAGSDITTVNYAHKVINFAFDPFVLNTGEHTIELPRTGTTDDTNFVGWIKEHEYFKNNQGVVSTALDTAHTFEIWGRSGVSGSFRILDFSDGFTSASPPATTGLLISQSEEVILNNQTTPLTITAFSFNSASVTSAVVRYEIDRTTDTNQKNEVGELLFFWDGSAWTMEAGQKNGDNSGVTFSLTGTTSADVQYISTDLTGANYDGTIKYYSTTFAV